MRTKQQELEAAMARGGIKGIPGLTEAMAQHEAAMAALDAKPYVKDEKRKRRAEAETTLRKHVADLVASARAHTVRPFDEEAGRLRAEARATGADASDAVVRSQVFRHTRASQLAARVERATTPADVHAAYEEARLTDDVESIRLVGLAARSRLQALAQVDKNKDMSALRTIAAQFDQTFADWQRANPSPVERLREIERLRGNAELEFDASADFALRLYGISGEQASPTLKPMPNVAPGNSGMRIGPGFDSRA